MPHDESIWSQPYGPAQSYLKPPYRYRDAVAMSVAVEFDRDGVTPFLAPDLQLADHRPFGVISASWYPDTDFGAYHELAFFVRVVFGDQPFMYSPLMYADGEAAVLAGREQWGFAKKWATMSLVEDAGSHRFTVDRPAGRPLVELTFLPRPAGVDDLLARAAHPTLTLRLIPGLAGEAGPAVMQLVATDNPKRLHVDQARPARVSGRASVVLAPGTAGDPVDGLRPTRVLGAWMSTYDCDLPGGSLIHDYLKESLT